jgi:two-component system phosphate regulon sensor histidine kinase PhoR
MMRPIKHYFYAMKPWLYRTLIITTLAALGGLLIVQVYWFVSAYKIEDKQFDNTVNIALRSVADKILKSENDYTTRILPINSVADRIFYQENNTVLSSQIKHTSSNSYFVEMRGNSSYMALDSIIKTEFKKHEIFGAYELAIYDHQADSLLVGNFYEHGIFSTDDVTCLRREPSRGAMDFSVTFPNRRADIIGSMNIWIFTAFTFLLILIVFGFMIINLSKQKKLAEIKADFLNNMTHELQTPIANIAMASEVLRSANGIDSEKALRYANIIHDENQRLKAHMEQVLQIAKMEKGEVRMNKQVVDINEVVNEVIRNFEERLQNRKGSIVKKLQASKTILRADPFHLTNIFYNLLDNAEKYSPEQPEIVISTVDKGNGILISVADKGIGISRSAQQFIFDKFYRAPTGNLHDIKGYGLGLTYVYEVVKAHTGNITVISEENKGSRFDLFFDNSSS